MDDAHFKTVSDAHDVDFFGCHHLLSTTPKQLAKPQVELSNVKVSLGAKHIDYSGIFLEIAGEVFLDESGLLVLGGVDAEGIGRLSLVFRLPNKLMIAFLA